MKFNSTEEIERWFKDWKYEVEVHNAIEFLIKENKERHEEIQELNTELMMLR